MKNQWITVVNCPIDTRDSESNQFTYAWLSVDPSMLRYRYSQPIAGEFTSINSPLFVTTCRDKRKTYQALLVHHPITYLGSKYFSLDSSKQYIVKPRYGHRKQWIQLLSGKAVIQREDLLTDQWIIQDYKETYYQGMRHHDIRCVMYGEQVIWSFIRYWRNILEDRKSEPFKLTPEFRSRVTKRAQKLLRITQTPHAIYSIDIGIEIKTHRPFVIECNSAIWAPSLLKADPDGTQLAAYLKNILS